ncbi:response regulator [Sphingomicrobium flavum]|uniref:response regulator n=1 Tax=Sphingomicrobium flavum TaxID=1229164 RepID=UPI0021ADF700|nr:response regulator [Sphingomicrobium flavum]
MQQGKGRRILLVEDSPVISLDTEDKLKAEGYFVVGPAYDMNAAIDFARNEQIDAALVDLNIRGQKSFDVLQILDERDIPYCIISGYADWTMPKEYEPRPRLQKPFDKDALLETVAMMADA